MPPLYSKIAKGAWYLPKLLYIIYPVNQPPLRRERLRGRVKCTAHAVPGIVYRKRYLHT